MSESTDGLLRKRSSRSTRLSSIASGISRRLSRTSSKSVTADNPLFTNKDDLFNEQNVLCSRFLSTQDFTCTSAPNGCNPPDALRQPSRYGIRLRVLQRIRDQLRQLPTEDGHVWSCTTVFKLLKTFTASQQCSFTSLLQNYEAGTQHPFAGGNTSDVSDAATVYVAQAWEIPFNVLVESLECFMENNHKDHNTTYFYVSGFSLNLHAELDKEEYMNGLWTCIGNYHDVVLVVDRWLNPVSFTRLWCLWELVAGIESQTTNVTLQLSKSESESFRAELSNGIEVIWDNFFSLNAETAMTSSEDDTKLINNHIKESISKEKIGMNQCIMKLLRGWLVDVCKAELEQSRMQDAQSDRTVRLMNNLGVLLLRESKLKEAEALYREGLRIREDTLDADHPDIATSCSLLGGVLYSLAKDEESKQLLRRALAIRENPISGCSELDIAQSCSDLGSLLRAMGKYDEAEALLQRSLGIRESVLGDKHIKVAQSCCNIGTLLECRTTYEESKRMYHRALTICEELLYPNHLEIAKCCSGMAVSLWRMKLNVDATPYFSRALKIREQMLDENHFLVARSINGIGTMAKENGNFEKAEVYYKRALEIRLKTQGENHPDVASSYCSLGILCGDDRLDEKLDWSTRALQVYKAAYSGDHVEVAMMYNNIAIIYEDLGRWKDAEQYYREAVRITVACLGEYNEDTLLYLNNLGIALHYDHSNRLNDALQVYQRIVRISTGFHGLNHQKTIEYLDNLVSTAKQSSCQQAEPYARLLVKASAGLNGENHMETAKYYSKLAVILEKQEKFEEAQKVYQKVVECKNEWIKLAHYDKLKVVEMLIKREKWEDAENMIQATLPSVPTSASSLYRDVRADCYMFLGIALERQNKLADALKAYDTAFHTYDLRRSGEASRRAKVHLGYCTLLARLGEPQKAYKRCVEAQFGHFISPELSVRVDEMRKWLSTLQVSEGVDDS